MQKKKEYAGIENDKKQQEDFAFEVLVPFFKVLPSKWLISFYKEINIGHRPQNDDTYFESTYELSQKKPNMLESVKSIKNKII